MPNLSRKKSALFFMSPTRAGFTLIEVLVSLAIVAVLSTVVVVTLNPAELMKQARDSNRISDLNTVNTALSTYAADVVGATVGASSTVYVSLPSNSSDCSDLGLPALPSGWIYKCATRENLTKIDGTGWIPANLQRISFGNPLEKLPIDPKNSTSTGLYYTFVTTGSWWELTSILESDKYGPRMVVDGGASPNAFEQGTNLTLTPIEALDRAVPTSVNAPTIASISPTSTIAGDPSFTLTITGENFTTSSVVRWSGNDKTTTFVSSTQLTAAILAADVVATGTAVVAVYDPVNGTSGSTSFAISEPPGFLAGSWTTEPNAGLAQNNGASMAEVGGKFYVITGNGVNFQKYDTATQAWTTLAVVPYSSVGNGASIVKYDNDTLYAIRGNTANNFYKYVISTNTWSNMGLPAAASGAGGSLAYPGTGDYIYLFGGASTNYFWRYSVSGNSWTYNDPTQGNGASIAEANGKYYIITGSGVEFREYNPATRAWTTLAVVPYSSVGNGASIVKYDNDTLYAIRGNTANNFYKYVISTNTWSNMATPPAASGTGGSIVYPGSGDFIYYLRGASTDSFWRYSVSNNVWSSNDPTQGAGASIVEVNGKYYVVTGNGVEFKKYDPSTRMWTSLTNILWSSVGNGTALTKFDNDTIYAVRGGTANHYRYTISTDTWTNLPAPPAAHGTGGSLAYPGTGNYLYSLRGASTNTFWRCDVTASSTWSALTSAPAAVGAGGALVAVGTDTLYALRGGNTTSFWKYTISTDTWEVKASTTAAIQDGGSLTTNGTDIFASRGNGTPTFYKYNIGTNTWSTLADAPGNIGVADAGSKGGISYSSATGKIFAISGISTSFEYNPSNNSWIWPTPATAPATVGSGGASVAVGSDTLYVFRGRNTTTFWKYTISTGMWETKSSAPDTIQDGGSLTTDGTNIFAFRGNGTATTYKYTVGTDTWSTLSDAPWTIGAADTNSKGGLAYSSATGKIYAISGSAEGFQYDPAANTWTWPSLAHAPATVGAGGALVALNSDTLYGFRGASTTEFWQYKISTGLWSSKAATPSTIQNGGSLTSDGVNIYALRGAGTPTFYKYTVATDSWSTLSDAPGNIGAANTTATKGAIGYSATAGAIFGISGNSGAIYKNAP